MKAAEKLFPAFVFFLGLVVLALACRDADDPPSGAHLRQFALVPVQQNGRIMPFDTWARTKLMVLSHYQEALLEIRDRNDKIVRNENGAAKVKWVPATEWGLESMVRRVKERAGIQVPEYRSFRVDNEDLVKFIGRERRPESGYLFRGDEIIEEVAEGQVGKFEGEVRRIRRMLAENPDKNAEPTELRDRKVLELAQALGVYIELGSLLNPNMAPPWVKGRGDSVADLPWMNLATMLDKIENGEQPTTQQEKLYKTVLLYARAKDDKSVEDFNQALDAYLKSVEAQSPEIMRNCRLEVFFNTFAPYKQCTILFVGVLVLSALSWVVWPVPMRRAAMGLAGLAMVVYTGALVARILISGYAPVTNLYSSAIFIGWGCALLCLVMEPLLRNGICLATGSATAIASLIIAHNLLDGDSMGKVVAVLNSNFWLSTHVICITLGYTATFVAGFMGIGYVGLGMFTPVLRRDHVLFSKMIYGVVCFAMFLSFVGTVLGGIWADQSWGRFWGWDPKENGALLIVIWNAVILHARWGGMVKSRGVALLAIAGNIVTAWSWFGTNLLGVGLHNYGFMQGAMYCLIGFVVSQLAIIAIGGLTPMSMWVSFRPLPSAPTPPPPSPHARPVLS